MSTQSTLSLHRLDHPPLQVALMAMIGGAVVAGLSDVTYSGLGYFWVSICVLSTAAYLLLIRKLKDTGVYEFVLK